MCLESMPQRQRWDFRVILALSAGSCAIADFEVRDLKGPPWPSCLRLRFGQL